MNANGHLKISLAHPELRRIHLMLRAALSAIQKAGYAAMSVCTTEGCQLQKSIQLQLNPAIMKWSIIGSYRSRCRNIATNTARGLHEGCMQLLRALYMLHLLCCISCAPSRHCAPWLPCPLWHSDNERRLRWASVPRCCQSFCPCSSCT